MARWTVFFLQIGDSLDKLQAMETFVAVVESGSFDELAARGGRFTDLLRAGGLKLEDKATKAVEGSNVMPFPAKGAVG